MLQRLTRRSGTGQRWSAGESLRQWGMVAEGRFACDNLNSELCPIRKFSP
jgi:hypothetical protein